MAFYWRARFIGMARLCTVIVVKMKFRFHSFCPPLSLPEKEGGGRGFLLCFALSFFHFYYLYSGVGCGVLWLSCKSILSSIGARGQRQRYYTLLLSSLCTRYIHFIHIAGASIINYVAQWRVRCLLRPTNALWLTVERSGTVYCLRMCEMENTVCITIKKPTLSKLIAL